MALQQLVEMHVGQPVHACELNGVELGEGGAHVLEQLGPEPRL